MSRNKSKYSRHIIDPLSQNSPFNIDGGGGASISNVFGGSLFGQNQGALFDNSLPSSIQIQNNGNVKPAQLPSFGAPETLTVSLEFDGKDDKFIFKRQRLTYDMQGNVLLAPLINQIREQGFDAKGHSVMYYSEQDSAYIFVQKDPVPDSACIALEELDVNKPIKIKLKPVLTQSPPPSEKRKQQHAQMNSSLSQKQVDQASLGFSVKRVPGHREPLLNQSILSNVKASFEVESQLQQYEMGGRQMQKYVPQQKQDAKQFKMYSKRVIKEMERQKDSDMLENLKKQLPTTESQNARDIDDITMPSTRDKVRRPQDFAKKEPKPLVDPHQNSFGPLGHDDNFEEKLRRMIEGPSNENSSIKGSQGVSSQQAQKRTKERSIEEIIEKVSLWRKLYNGVLRDGNLVRYSLEDAAGKVGVSKKSLDDYLLQMRFGKKYGFDFQKHKHDKVGTLRTFVKKKKKQEKDSKGVKGKGTSMIEKEQVQKKPDQL